MNFLTLIQVDCIAIYAQLNDDNYIGCSYIVCSGIITLIFSSDASFSTNTVYHVMKFKQENEV